MATVQSDIFKPTKYGGKYTVTLIPGMNILQPDALGKMPRLIAFLSSR
jgi:hypothetical protein